MSRTQMKGLPAGDREKRDEEGKRVGKEMGEKDIKRRNFKRGEPEKDYIMKYEVSQPY